MPTISLGKSDIKLPKLTAKNEYNSNVDYNLISIKVQKEDNDKIYQVLENNNYSLNMTIGENGFDKTKLGLASLNYEDLVALRRIAKETPSVYAPNRLIK